MTYNPAALPELVAAIELLMGYARNDGADVFAQADAALALARQPVEQDELAQARARIAELEQRAEQLRVLAEEGRDGGSVDA